MNLTIKPLTFTTNTTGFDRHLKELFRKLEAVVDKTTYDIKALSQSYVPVDQGVAKASHFAVTSQGSDREQAITEATELAATEPSKWGNKGRKVQFDSEDEELAQLHGFVCVAVVYALELEFGYTTGSLNVRASNPNAQRPFLTVAMDEMEEPFIKACTEVFRSLK